MRISLGCRSASGRRVLERRHAAIVCGDDRAGHHVDRRRGRHWQRSDHHDVWMCLDGDERLELHHDYARRIRKRQRHRSVYGRREHRCRSNRHAHRGRIDDYDHTGCGCRSGHTGSFGSDGAFADRRPAGRLAHPNARGGQRGGRWKRRRGHVSIRSVRSRLVPRRIEDASGRRRRSGREHDELARAAESHS